MNKNRRKKPLKALKAVIICGAFFLIFCACLSIIIVRTGAQAAQLDAAATATLTQSTAADPTLVLDVTPTAIIPTVIIPIPTPTPTPAPAPTATPKPAPTATPRPAPTPTPAPAPTATPGIPITQPTPTVVGGGIIPPGTIPTTTNTPTAHPSPTPKPHTTPTPSDSTPTTATTTTANTAGSTDTTPNQNQNASSGMSALVMPIAFGLASAVLLTAVLGFFFLRKQKGGKQLPFSTFSQALAQTAQPAPWLNQSNANAAFAAPGGDHFNAANEQTLMQQQVASSTPAAAFGAAPIAIAMPSSTQKREAVANTVKPVLYQSGFETIPYPSSSDLRPLTTPLPKQGGNFPQKNPVSTSDMNPLLLDNLDFATILAPDNGQNEAPLDAPAITGKNPIAASSLIAPSIQDDPILETIMRQAQMGIYAIADKDPGDINDAASDAFLS